MGKDEGVLAKPCRRPPDVFPLPDRTPTESFNRPKTSGKNFVAQGQALRINGVTYGPFRANATGNLFPPPEQVREDFAAMSAIGLNAIRTYHLPPDELLNDAEASGLRILIDVPWSKHLCFLESRHAQRQARDSVRRIALAGRGHRSVLAYSIGNEIPPDVVRWHGVKRVQRFLAELCDTAKQADPDGLVTYANYPPTEYLELPFLDFATFNVYLHDRSVFQRYLVRLQNLVGEKPLVLGELGLDTLRHGELQQADFLAGHLREAALIGLAGAFIFSWTDDWHTGGCAIDDWAFGITHRDRSPKASLWALQETLTVSPAEMLPSSPRVSVVVCSYNGARTLVECLAL